MCREKSKHVRFVRFILSEWPLFLNGLCWLKTSFCVNSNTAKPILCVSFLRFTISNWSPSAFVSKALSNFSKRCVCLRMYWCNKRQCVYIVIPVSGCVVAAFVVVYYACICVHWMEIVQYEFENYVVDADWLNFFHIDIATSMIKTKTKNRIAYGVLQLNWIYSIWISQ